GRRSGHMLPNSGGRLRPGMIVSQSPPVATGGLGGDNSLMKPLLQSEVPGVACRRGKVRDVYDLGDRLVLVATDRLSAFDWVLPTGIPDKGRILTGLTLFWLDWLGVPNHLLETDPAKMPAPFAARRSEERRVGKEGR